MPTGIGLAGPDCEKHLMSQRPGAEPFLEALARLAFRRIPNHVNNFGCDLFNRVCGGASGNSVGEGRRIIHGSATGKKYCRCSLRDDPSA